MTAGAASVASRRNRGTPQRCAGHLSRQRAGLSCSFRGRRWAALANDRTATPTCGSLPCEGSFCRPWGALVPGIPWAWQSLRVNASFTKKPRSGGIP